MTGTLATVLECVGCGLPYKPKNSRQIRCKPDCNRIRPKRKDNRRGRYVIHHTEFIGVDGEGITTDKGHHAYMVLSVGNDSLHTGYRLTYREIFPFLWEQYLANRNAAFVGFYLKYDFTHWLRDLPEERARMLLTDEGRAKRARTKSGANYTPFPVEYQGWEFDMLAMKRFKLRPKGSDEGWFYVSDAGPFWQCSFLKAIDPTTWSVPILTDSEYNTIREGKAHRSTAVVDPAMFRYNTLENDVLARIMGKIAEGFRKQEWKLQKTQWYGPGQAAAKWMNSVNGILNSTVRERVPPETLKAAQSSYYGGWFEIPIHGHIPGVTYEYDINSAYPHIISRLPCLLHGNWSRGDGYNPDARYQLSHISSYGTDPIFGGLPHRDKSGKITRPSANKGWYWTHEIEASKRADLIDSIQVHDTWTYTPCTCLPPYHNIRELYNARLEVGKNTPHGRSLRLVYNSAYGKFAQSVGSPKFANPIYASLITADCRTEILNAIATHPRRSRDVAMVATDGIYFRTPHSSLPLSGDTLGEWDVTEKHNMTLFKPGVYWDDKTRAKLADENLPIKSRGINAQELGQHIAELDQMFEDWSPGDEWPTLAIPIRFSIITPNLALARGKWDSCGTIRTYDLHGETKTESSDPSGKRDTENVRYTDGIITTDPYTDLGETTPYSKTFGIAEFEDESELNQTDERPIQHELFELLAD